MAPSLEFKTLSAVQGEIVVQRRFVTRTLSLCASSSVTSTLLPLCVCVKTNLEWHLPKLIASRVMLSVGNAQRCMDFSYSAQTHARIHVSDVRVPEHRQLQMY